MSYGTGTPTSVPSPYCVRADVEDVFGSENVVKWADLNNKGEADEVAARIAWAIRWASNEVDSRLRRFIYVLPLANEGSVVPVEVVDVTATLAGVWLYENRGVQDFDPETGVMVHRLEWNRKRAERTLQEILAGTRMLDAVPRSPDDNVPKVVDEDET